MVKTIFLTLISLAVGLTVYLYVYLGAYKPVQIQLEKRGPFELVFKAHTGAYHKISLVIQEVEGWATSHALPCPQTFGEYLDDPQSVDEDRLRSRGGCLLTAPLSTVPPEYQYQHRSERQYAVARFQGSPAIGPFKVYPKMRQFLEQNRLRSNSPVIEIYTVNGNQVATEYLFAIDGGALPPAAH